MSVFRESAHGLRRMAADGSLGERIAERLRMAGGVGVSAAERRSWDRSLPVLAQDLVDAGLGAVEMLVEYQLPLTSRRADVVLAGTDPRTGNDSFAVVELKQWTRARSYDGEPTLVSVDHVVGPRLHPGLQVGDYCRYLTGFLGIAHQSPSMIKGVAYLHNAVDHDVDDLFALPPTEQSRIFTTQRRAELRRFLLHHLAPDGSAADRFLGSAVRPSRTLLAVAAEEIREREMFTLLEDQRVAYELVMHRVRAARRKHAKTVIVVAGGPGSGKSVIALSLLGELARQGRPALHATGSRSFTQTLRKVAGRGSSQTRDLFKYFNSFMSAEANDIEVLICDEAHRVRQTSANRFTRAGERTGRPQLDELMSAARVPVFLLDEHQVVKPGELGSVDVITDFARCRGFEVEVVWLHDQYRCGGSAEYERWVLDLLGLEGGAPTVWEGDGRFDVRVAESPQELEFLVGQQRDAGYSARMAAGYCWPWSDPHSDGSLVPDVQIGAWSRPWNLKSDRSIGGAPGSAFWATDPSGFGQVGCVYTAQGFEYDWSGVIIGPDLVARDGQLVTVRAASKDPAFRSRKTLGDEVADQLIRNTYKVLLTRGMVGTVVYATDLETRRFLVEHVAVRRSPATRWLSR